MTTSHADLRRHIVVIGGFRQAGPAGRAWTGMKALARRALELSLAAYRGGGEFAPVHLVEWSDDVEGLAAYIRQLGGKRVLLVAYSWGAGRGAVRFAEACESEGVMIDEAILIDPVYYNWAVPALALARWLRWLLPIRLPISVQGPVTVLRQTRTRPMGFPVITWAGAPAHDIDLTADGLPYGHADIDNAGEVAARVEAAVRRFVGLCDCGRGECESRQSDECIRLPRGEQR